MPNEKIASSTFWRIALLCLSVAIIPRQALSSEAVVYSSDVYGGGGKTAESFVSATDTWFLVSPRVLSLSLPVGMAAKTELSVANLGGSSIDLQFGMLAADSDVSRDDSSRVLPKVLWSQTQSGIRGVAAGYSLFSDSGSYVGDDFFLSAPATVTQISAIGFNNFGTLEEQALEINWFIFPDSGGVPAGDPERNPEAAVFHFTAIPGDLGVELSDDNIVLDLKASSSDLLHLDAGSYWLVIVPVFDFEIESGARRWNWSEGRPAQAFSAQILSPELFLIPDWLDIPTRIPQVPEFAGLAFSIEGWVTGESSPVCIDEFPAWFSVATESTVISPGATREFDLHLDASMSPIGATEIVLCIENDVDVLVPLFVPIKLNTFLDPIFSDSFEVWR